MGTYTVTDLRADYSGGLPQVVKDAEAVPGSAVNFAVTGTINLGE
jgi:hypothetical protein